jgi:drug/metabolite transporter (DMT)-like permease
MKVSPKPYIYIILAGILTGTIGIFVKLIGSEIHFMTLVFYRMILGFIFVLAVVPFIDKNAFKVKQKDLKDYFIVGVLFATTLSLFVVANLFAPVQNVVLITNFSPFLVLILAYFFLKEKITKTKIITLIIGIVGIIIINPFKFGENALGNYLALTQMVFYSFLVVRMRKEDKKHSIGAIIWFFFFATLLLLPFPFIFGWGNLSEVLWLVLGLGIFSTGFAYLFHNLALEKIGAEISSIFIMLTMPLSGIVLAFFILGEELNLRIIIGGIVLIIAGIYLQAHNKKVKKAISKIFDFGI